MATSLITVRQLGFELPSPSPEAPAVPARKAAATSKNWIDYLLPFMAVLGVVGVWLIVFRNIADSDYKQGAAPAAPAEGLTIFAVFFVAAAGLERLLEPFSILWDRSKDTAQAALKETVAAVSDYKTKVKVWSEATETAKAAAKGEADTAAQEVDTKLTNAAKKQAAAAAVSGRKAVVVWALATALGILASASLKLYLLKQVGIASPPRQLEILATGLIIGAGTKPLHDLVKLIEKAKEKSAATAAAGTASPS